MRKDEIIVITVSGRGIKIWKQLEIILKVVVI